MNRVWRGRAGTNESRESCRAASLLVRTRAAFTSTMFSSSSSCSSSSLPTTLAAAMLLLLASSAVPTTDAGVESSSSSSSGGGAQLRGLTDDSPLAQRPGVPDASLCESGEAGHRRATTMGDDFLKLGKTLRAEACYLGALRYKSDFPMALYGLGEVHSREKRDGLAREAYQLAIDVWPQYVDAHIALGDLHHRNGRPKKAEASYNAAVKAAPTDPIAWESLGKHQLLTHQPDRAENTYKRAVLKATNGAQSPGLILGLAKAAHAQNNHAECVEHGEKAASLAPGFGMARHAVGKCKIALGDTAGGVAAMREAAKVEPDVVEHHTDLAAVLRNQGQLDAAEEALEAGLVALPGDATLEMAKLSMQMTRAAGNKSASGGGSGGESGEL